jgi:hypothetical protein
MAYMAASGETEETTKKSFKDKIKDSFK